MNSVMYGLDLVPKVRDNGLALGHVTEVLLDELAAAVAVQMSAVSPPSNLSWNISSDKRFKARSTIRSRAAMPFALVVILGATSQAAQGCLGQNGYGRFWQERRRAAVWRHDIRLEPKWLRTHTHTHTLTHTHTHTHTHTFPTSSVGGGRGG